MQEKTLSEIMDTLATSGKYEEQGEHFMNATGTTMTVEEVTGNARTLPVWHGDKEDIDTRMQYHITLSNKYHSFTFDFWGCARDIDLLKKAEELQKEYHATEVLNHPKYADLKSFMKDKGIVYSSIKWSMNPSYKRVSENKFLDAIREAIKPNAYNVLCAINYMPDSFSDFCNDMDMDEDSKKAEQTYNSIKEQEAHMRKMFDRNEIEALTHIQ